MSISNTVVDDTTRGVDLSINVLFCPSKKLIAWLFPENTFFVSKVQTVIRSVTSFESGLSG